jgi:hypothetical protein
VLQSRRHVAGKGSYGALAGVEHAAIHAALTVPCLLAVGVTPLPVVLAAIAELTVHYHLDWTKERVSRSGRFSPADQDYWVLHGGDQLAHQLTFSPCYGYSSEG